MTFDEVRKRVLGAFRTSFPGLPLGLKKFLGRSARAMARVLWGSQKAVEDLDKDIVPSTESSTELLSSWATLIGLPDGDGGYGPLKTTAASGGAALLTGVKGTIYPNNATATAEDGTTQVKLSGGQTIPGSPPGFGSIAGSIIAVTKGVAGNLPAGTVLTWDNPPAGADATLTLTSPLTEGLDVEDNPSVYARIVSRMQNPPRGGVDADYAFWILSDEEVEGVVGVYVYPRRFGTGTVGIVIVGGGSGAFRVPSEAVRDEAQEAVDAHRPAAVESADVILPFAATAGRRVRVKVKPQPGYEFDWDDTAASYTVDTGGYSIGPPATLRLSALAPASLKAAITAYVAGIGLAPRLQVLSTGKVVNQLIRAVAFSDGGGKTTLTLETVPGGWAAPANNDPVHAGGPVVETIATGILALADSLGPSRLGGLGSVRQPWPDTLTISGIIAVAENALDTDGSKLIDKVPVNQATIDDEEKDAQGTDSTIVGPELLHLAYVAVTAAP